MLDCMVIKFVSNVMYGDDMYGGENINFCIFTNKEYFVPLCGMLTIKSILCIHIHENTEINSSKTIY